MPPVRIGCIDYLNAAPLTVGLEGEPGLTCLHGTPSAIADGLAGGRIDVGLVPVVEAARLGLSALPGIGVAAEDAVWSVLLLARKPVGELRRVSLDPASRTSAALVRILLALCHVSPAAWLEGSPRGSVLPEDADAALLIGDRALRLYADEARSGTMEPPLVVDLAAWWHRETGLPFVFAVWAGPSSAAVLSAASSLQGVLGRNLERLEELARIEGPRRGIDAKLALEYLRSAVRYRLGAPERAGLERFLSLGRRLGLLEAGSAIRWCG